MDKIELVNFCDEDDIYKLLYKWCSNKFVYEWFEQRILSYDEIVKKYKKKLLAGKQKLLLINYNNKTGLINLMGDVKITSHDGKVMQTQQMYYDQKNNWFFTEHYFKVTDKNKSFFEGIGVDFDQNFKIVNAQQNRAELKEVSDENL